MTERRAVSNGRPLIRIDFASIHELNGWLATFAIRASADLIANIADGINADGRAVDRACAYANGDTFVSINSIRPDGDSVVR